MAVASGQLEPQPRGGGDGGGGGGGDGDDGGGDGGGGGGDGDSGDPPERIAEKRARTASISDDVRCRGHVISSAMANALLSKAFTPLECWPALMASAVSPRPTEAPDTGRTVLTEPLLAK